MFALLWVLTKRIFTNGVFIYLVTLSHWRLAGEKLTVFLKPKSILQYFGKHSPMRPHHSCEVEMTALFLFGETEVEKKESFQLWSWRSAVKLLFTINLRGNRVLALGLFKNMLVWANLFMSEYLNLYAHENEVLKSHSPSLLGDYKYQVLLRTFCLKVCFFPINKT